MGKSISGETTIEKTANKISRLYRHLDEINLTWDTATEEDIKIIRNAILCWDKNDNKDENNFDYKAIKEDTFNQMLSVWFKFYKYMNKLGIESRMIMRTKKIKKFYTDSMLSHISQRTDYDSSNNLIEVWGLRVSSSPYKQTFHALSRREFALLQQELKKIDMVYELLAYFIVETGLRIRAVLRATSNDFKGYLRLRRAGKGGSSKYYELPMRTLQYINVNYGIREYNDRYSKYEQKCKIKNKKPNDIFWIREDGKEINYNDVIKAFTVASKNMGRFNESITPHWLRHTFATWTIIDASKQNNIALENTGSTPNVILIKLLQQKMGHSIGSSTILRYIATAIKLMGLSVNKGPILMSVRAFSRNMHSQELLKCEARIEFGDLFNNNKYNGLKYGISRGILTDDEK